MAVEPPQIAEYITIQRGHARIDMCHGSYVAHGKRPPSTHKYIAVAETAAHGRIAFGGGPHYEDALEAALAASNRTTPHQGEGAP